MLDREMQSTDDEQIEGDEDREWENAADALLSAWKCPVADDPAPAAEQPKPPTNKEASDFSAPPAKVRGPPLDFRALGGLPSALEALGISTPTTSSARVNSKPRAVPAKKDPSPSSIPVNPPARSAAAPPEGIGGEHAEAEFASCAATVETCPGERQRSDSHRATTREPFAGEPRTSVSTPTQTPTTIAGTSASAPTPRSKASEEPTPPIDVDFQSLGGARHTVTFEALGLPKLPSGKQCSNRQGSKECPGPISSSCARVLQSPCPPQPSASPDVPSEMPRRCSNVKGPVPPPDFRPVVPEQHVRPERHQFPCKVELNETEKRQAQHRTDANPSAKVVPAEVAQMQAAMKKHLGAAHGDAEQMRAALRARMAEQEQQVREQRRVDEAKVKKAKLAEQWKRELEEACHREEEKLRQEYIEARKRERARREAEQQHFHQQQRQREEQARRQSQFDHGNQRSASAQRPSAAYACSTPKRQRSVPLLKAEKGGIEAELQAVQKDIFHTLRRIGSESNLDKRRQQMRDLVRNWHPDKHPADDSRRQQIATAAFQLIQANRQQVMEGCIPKHAG